MWTCRLRVWNVRQPRKSAHVFTRFSFRLRTNKCGELDFDVFTAAQLQWVFLKEARHTIQFNSTFVANSINNFFLFNQLFYDYDEWFTTVRLEVFKSLIKTREHTPARFGYQLRLGLRSYYMCSRPCIGLFIEYFSFPHRSNVGIYGTFSGSRVYYRGTDVPNFKFPSH